MNKAILCGKLLDTENRRVLEDMVILIDGVTIAAVESRNGFVVPDNLEVIDLSDKFVMPGLIDCHVHLAFDKTDQFYLTDNIGKITLNALMRGKRNLLAGFTTVRDMSAPYLVDMCVRDSINCGQSWGPRVFISGSGISATGGHGDSHFPCHIKIEGGMSIIADGPAEILKAARSVAKYGVDCIKLMATGGVMSQGDMPGMQKYTQEEMHAAVEFAEGEGLPTAAHALGARGIEAAAKAGISSIEHGTMADAAAIRAMAEHGTYLVPTIVATRGIAEQPASSLPPWVPGKCRMALEKQREAVGMAIKEGVKIAFGTDAATPGNTHGTQTREFMFMTEMGMTPMAALTAATTNAASLLRHTSTLGSIVPGKYADIVAYDKNPLEDISIMKCVSFVMKDGFVYKKNGEATLPDIL